MTIREKIEEVKAAYIILKPFVDTNKYYAYLEGLIVAYNLEIDSKEESGGLHNKTQ